MDFVTNLHNCTNLTTTDKVIRDFVLCHLGEIGFMSVNTLAKRAFTSPAAVIRFCQRLGYEGYKDFKEDCMHYLSYSSFDIDIDYNFPFNINTSIVNISEIILKLEQEALKQFSKLLSSETIEEIYNTFENTKTIYVYGIGTNQHLGKEFVFRLEKLCYRVVSLSESSVNLNYTLQNIDETDCVIVISYSGTNRFIRTLFNNIDSNIKVIAITSRPDSFLGKSAHISLLIPPLETFDNKISTFASGACTKAALDILYALLFKVNYNKNLSLIHADSDRLKFTRNL